jgi:hypothetical protein
LQQPRSYVNLPTLSDFPEERGEFPKFALARLVAVRHAVWVGVIVLLLS